MDAARNVISAIFKQYLYLYLKYRRTKYWDLKKVIWNGTVTTADKQILIHNHYLI